MIRTISAMNARSSRIRLTSRSRPVPVAGASAAVAAGALGVAALMTCRPPSSCVIPSDAAMMSSLVAVPRRNSWITRPLLMTSSRSGTCTASSSSDVAKTMPRPRLACCVIRSKMSAFAPTSTPRVGSSSSSTRGSVSRALPITTFCWLPPLSEPIGACELDVLTVTALTMRSTAVRSLPCWTENRRTKRPRLASVRFCPTDIDWTRPSRWRSSGTSATPAARRWAIDSWSSGCPSSVTWPLTGRSLPASVSSSSVRPAPMSP